MAPPTAAPRVAPVSAEMSVHCIWHWPLAMINENGQRAHRTGEAGDQAVRAARDGPQPTARSDGHETDAAAITGSD
jgi:hypothetical protein